MLLLLQTTALKVLRICVRRFDSSRGHSGKACSHRFCVLSAPSRADAALCAAVCNASGGRRQPMDTSAMLGATDGEPSVLCADFVTPVEIGQVRPRGPPSPRNLGSNRARRCPGQPPSVTVAGPARISRSASREPAVLLAGGVVVHTRSVSNQASPMLFSTRLIEISLAVPRPFLEYAYTTPIGSICARTAAGATASRAIRPFMVFMA